MKPSRLPYYCDPRLLPAPLPTKQEIEASTRILAQEGWHKVVAVGRHFIVKYGPTIRQIEGENLLFVNQHSNIPAPRLYAMYRDDDSKLYLVMEAVDGDTLANLWPTLSSEAKCRIMAKLGSIVKELRSLPPAVFYGSLTGEGLPHPLFWSRENDPSECGPFQSQNDFNLALAKRSRCIWEENGKPGYISDFFEKYLSRVLHDHPPTFTHGDLQRKNIIVRPVPSNDPGIEQDYDLTLVDWESAAWYPTYWEYANTMLGFQWDDDWLNMLETVITPYPAEAVMMKMVWQALIS